MYDFHVVGLILASAIALGVPLLGLCAWLDQRNARHARNRRLRRYR